MQKIVDLTKLFGAAVAVTAALFCFMYAFTLGGWKALSVQTGSMRPAIKPGDLVLIRKTPPQNIKVGDVITFINPNDSRETITHRVTAISGAPQGLKSYYTKGDANNRGDQFIPQTKVLGVVGHKLPYAGRVIDFIRQPLGLLAIIYVPALLIIINELRRLAAYYKSQLPYRAPGYNPFDWYLQPRRSIVKPQLLITAIMLVAIIAAPSGAVLALLNTQARLTNNSLSIRSTSTPTTPPSQGSSNTTCTVTNNNNAVVTNTNNQSASSGNSSVTNNTNGGTATSGNATNSNSSTTNVSVQNNGCSQTSGQ